MVTHHRYFAGILIMLLMVGCASTKGSRHQLVTGPLPRPAHIWVADFAATASDIPQDSALAGHYGTKDMPQTAEDIAIGRKLGTKIATELVKKIREMGMPAEHLISGRVLQVNDIVLRGYIISFDEGDVKKRVAVGLGSGASELKVAVEGFQVVPGGLRRLGYGTTDSDSNKTPGAAVGAAVFIATSNPLGLIVSGGMKVYGEASGSSKVEGRAVQTAEEIADVLKMRFKQQGWI